MRKSILISMIILAITSPGFANELATAVPSKAQDSTKAFTPIGASPGFADELAFDINVHAPITFDGDSSVTNDIPELKLEYTFDNDWQLWASYEENTNMYYGRRTFEVTMPGIGAGYRFADNKYSIYTQAGAYFPEFKNMHGYVEGLHTLAVNTVGVSHSEVPHFSTYEAEANWGLGFSLGSKIKITDSLHANLGFRYLRYDWSIHMHNDKPYKSAGAEHWWFTETQEQFSAFIGLGYTF